MKRLLVTIAVAGLGLALAPAQAQGTECIIGPNVEATEGNGIQHCEFHAQDVPAHGYIGLTPNDFRVYVDVNDNNAFDEGDVEVAFVSPSGFEPIAGQLTLEAGALYDVDLYEGCVDPACGWVGVLIVG